MLFKNIAAATAAAAAWVVAGQAFAQPAPTIIVAFTGVDTSVPVGPWASVAAGLFILVLAATIFRRRRARQSVGRGLWSVALAAVAGAAAMTFLPVDTIRSAYAAGGPIQLLTSPTNIVIGGAATFITAQNGTGTSIRIVSVTLANPVGGQVLEGPPNTTCVTGLLLSPGQTCNISVVSAGG